MLSSWLFQTMLVSDGKASIRLMVSLRHVSMLLHLWVEEGMGKKRHT